MLALGIVTAHVADQGGITKLTDPAWIGWGYRLTEVGGLATVAVIVLLGRWRPVWAAPLLLGVGPMVAYLTSRTVGLPATRRTSATGATGPARCPCSSRPHSSFSRAGCCAGTEK
jgi:hypothetical protein